MAISNDIFKNTDGKENPVVGKEFEITAQQYFRRLERLELTRSFELKIGLREKKKHQFDLGSERMRVLVECKCHTWMRNGNTPTGKMHAWNEAMFLFYLAPDEYRKILLFCGIITKSEKKPWRSITLEPTPISYQMALK